MMKRKLLLVDLINASFARVWSVWMHFAAGHHNLFLYISMGSSWFNKGCTNKLNKQKACVYRLAVALSRVQTVNRSRSEVHFFLPFNKKKKEEVDAQCCVQGQSELNYGIGGMNDCRHSVCSPAVFERLPTWSTAESSWHLIGRERHFVTQRKVGTDHLTAAKVKSSFN